MSILLEVQKYNHYRILQEAYVPKEVKFAITEDKKYVIVDSELFDIEKNESLGLYYESRLLKEEIITESWFETIADIAVGVGSAALAATGVGVAAAQAIDVLHGLSFIYRGNTRNDKVLTVMGYFSLALALFPALGTAMKNVLVAIAKKFVGKPIASLIKAIAKNKVGLNIVKKLQGMISKLSGKITQFNTWAKEYKWFDKVWSKIGNSFAGGLKYFDDFLGKVVKESSKSGAKALPSAGAKAAQKALPAAGAKGGQLVVVKSADDVVKLGTQVGVTVSDDAAKLMFKVVGTSGLTKEMVKKLLSNKDSAKLIMKFTTKFKNNPEMLSSALRNMAQTLPASVISKNSGQMIKVLGSKPGAILLPQTAKSLRNSGQLVVRNGQEMIKIIKWPKVKTKKLKIIDIPFKEVVKSPSMFKKIPNAYKYAAALLTGVGLGSLISGDDNTYVVYDDEIVKGYKESGGEVEESAFSSFEQEDFNKAKKSAFSDFESGDVKTKGGGVKGKSKTSTSKSTKPTVVTDYDRAWDYMKKGGKYYTKRKGKTNWIHVTPEMKGGKPYQSIKTNVFKD